MSSQPAVHGTVGTSLVVDMMTQNCMNCQLQWQHHTIVGFDFNNKVLQMSCLDRPQPTVIIRAPAIEPTPPPAIGREHGYLPPPPMKMIEPRRNQ